MKLDNMDLPNSFGRNGRGQGGTGKGLGGIFSFLLGAGAGIGVTMATTKPKETKNFFKFIGEGIHNFFSNVADYMEPPDPAEVKWRSGDGPCPDHIKKKYDLPDDVDDVQDAGAKNTASATAEPETVTDSETKKETGPNAGNPRIKDFIDPTTGLNGIEISD